MKPSEYRELIHRLRTQIRKDVICPPLAYPEQLAKANLLIDELARFHELLPDIKSLIPMLRQGVKAFYSESSHRGWAQQFTLNDLDKLEAFCPPEEGR